MDSDKRRIYDLNSSVCTLEDQFHAVKTWFNDVYDDPANKSNYKKTYVIQNIRGTINELDKQIVKLSKFTSQLIDIREND